MNRKVLTTYFFGRLISKTFILPFILVTLLCIMDLAVLRLGGAYLAYMPIGYDISYGTIVSLYLLCIIEALGMSVFAKAASRAWKDCKIFLRMS